MVMTDVSGSKDRAGALGRLGVAYGVGIVVGPPVGGESSSLALSISHLSPPSLPQGYVTTLYSEQLAAGIAAGLCVVSIGIVLLCVPETTKDPSKVEAAHRDQFRKLSSTSPPPCPLPHLPSSSPFLCRVWWGVQCEGHPQPAGHPSCGLCGAAEDSDGHPSWSVPLHVHCNQHGEVWAHPRH